MRTIYIWHALALFARNSYGTYIKPTEGICEQAYKTIKKQLGEGGYWIWIATSKSTDIIREKKSYILGAVWISGIVETERYKKEYNSKRVMEQFGESKDCDYQLVIPMNEYARRELRDPIIMHEYKRGGGENRENGVWMPMEGASVYEALQNAEYV